MNEADKGFFIMSTTQNALTLILQVKKKLNISLPIACWGQLVKKKYLSL